MTNRVVTDRAEALLMAGDEPADESYRTIPIARAAPAPAHGDCIACSWCGSFSIPGPGCDSCGSPLS